MIISWEIFRSSTIQRILEKYSCKFKQTIVFSADPKAIQKMHFKGYLINTGNTTL